jgi:hypothetical protein
MVEESKNDTMHAAYMPCIITKESILSASPSQLEMLLQHVVLVKDPAVPKKFKPTWVYPSLILMSSISKLIP